mgnify:CR=1 FL=1
MRPVLPVIIEDLISKVTNKNTHVEQRQHYATTLKTIVEESQKALEVYETHRKFRK